VIVIVVLSSGARSDGAFVCGSYNNEIGLNGNAGYVCLIGLLTTLFTFSGYEAGGHIAEETQGARRAAPRGIVMCCVIGAVVGFIYIIGLLFACPDADTILGGNSSSPVVNVYALATGVKGGLGLTSLLIINLFFAGSSSITVTSRIAFAMARDGAFPGSKHLYKVNPVTKSPIHTVVLVWIFDSLLLLLPLVNTTAFNAIVSLTTIGFQISYAIPIFLRVTDARDSFPPGAFNLGRYSIIIGWISSIWLTLTSLLFFWPSAFPVNSESMNYTVVVVGGVMIICLFFWVVIARHYFEGPKRKAPATDDETIRPRDEEEPKENVVLTTQDDIEL